MNALVIDASAANAKLEALAPSVAAKAKDVVARNADALLANVQARVPAKLAASLRAEVSDNGATARITSDAPYARIREYGGRIAVPEITPVAAKVLAFSYRGKIVFAAHTKAHDVNVVAEPYLAPALAEIAPQFRDDLAAALSEIGS
jgi:Bacteriophage HK97-gp10, putative tail-component